MKKLNYKKLELENLSNQELLEINGGTNPAWYSNPMTAFVATAIYVVKECVDDWKCFKDGLFGKDYRHK